MNEDDEFIEDDETNSAKLFERSRIRALADERESVQKKTFLKWVNSHLARVGCKIQDLYVDLRDGKMLIRLLEVLSGERLPNPTKGKMRIHCLENVDKSLMFLNEQRVHLENVGAHDIVDGSPRLTLGLIWTIILRFQIQDITIEQVDSSEIKSAKDALLLWCQMKTAGYPNVNVRNFTTSWKDGLAFNALIHKHRPDLIEYNKLTKVNNVANLNNAFNVAEEKLNLTRLLDAEDVNVDFPDEKSIITYVVTYYHYFSKMKADSVQGRRVGKVVNLCLENDQMIADYENLTSDLLTWIKQTIEELNDRNFANSLTGVQQQLSTFNTYRNVGKPPKFIEKGNLEVLLFTIQSKMRANNQKPYMPTEGRMIADINRAWELLEKAEHGRELALREELIRQEKLEQLAARFDRKAGMRETWLSENQRLVAQDNFGFDLAAVEAATKKHEAIVTDINAYEERVQAVVSVAQELETENYHDSERINARKDNVLRLWEYLLELLRARRQRLELSLQLQKIFEEMICVLEWMDEIKLRLSSEDYGKHLMGVEDLLQKQSLLEADINIVGDRVKNINTQAQRFVDEDFPEAGYRPCDPQVVVDRQRHLIAAYEELLQLAAARRARLGESRTLWQFYWDMADTEGWIREKEQLMSSPDWGHDLTSILLLVKKHKATEDELNARRNHLQDELQVGKDLITAGNFGSVKIQETIDDIEKQWSNMKELSDFRKKRLAETVDFFQFFADADDVDTWMLDTLRLVSSEDVGHDEASVQSLVKKHKDITDELQNYQNVIKSLHEQAANLSEQDRESPEVTSRLASIDRRYQELLELANIRKQRLLDALALYKLYNESNNVEQWITEKEKLLHTMVASEDIEEVEIQKARYNTFDQEMKTTLDKVGLVNQLSSQLIDNEHPNSVEVASKEKMLNEKWMALKKIADDKKDALQLAHDVNTFHIESAETMTWIRDKAKLIESTDELGNDLGSIITLQRRLSGLERDLAAIDAKVASLQEEADKLSALKPEEAPAIQEKMDQITNLWQDLRLMLKERDEKLGEASDLQKFLQNLDHFQQWLTKTQMSIASESIPNDVAEAEDLLQQHAQIKTEIDAYAPEYDQMKDYGSKVVEGQQDVQYMFLRERLKGLDDGWHDLKKMWENKQNLLIQNLNLQMFLRDCKQAEILLGEQENFLNKETLPLTSESCDNQIRQVEAFIKTLDANDEKINIVQNFASRLVDSNHFAADKIRKKTESLKGRRDANRQKADEKLDKLKDFRDLQKFMQDCDELTDWLGEKSIAAQDDTYRDAKSIHSKYMRHQAFELEIKSNKDQLEKLLKDGQKLIAEKPELAKEVQPKLEELSLQFNELQDTVSTKGQKLFDANRPQLYEQSCDDIDGWITEIESQIVTEDVGHDLTTVNLLVQKQNILESQLKLKEEQVKALETQAPYLSDIDPSKSEELAQKKARVEDRFRKMLQPLMERREKLNRVKRVHQFLRDVEDEKLWISERLARARSTNYGNSLLSVQMLQSKNKSLRNEIDSHEPSIIAVVDSGLCLIEEGHPQKEEFQQLIADLNKRWEELIEAIEQRKYRLALSEQAQQYFFDAAECEAWMGEQELFMISEDRAKDENGAMNMIKKHANVEKTVEDYADTIRQLSERSRYLIDNKHPDSDAIAVKQAQVDKLYASLKDLAGDRKVKLDEVLKLYLLNRDIEDIEQWIAEREVVAGSHELGQDFEHVTMLRDKFKEFARDTETVGQERVLVVNGTCDALIHAGHTDAATIAEWKDGINESWTDLLELMDTRTQMLQASWELFKFFNDCKETLDRIHEKELLILDDVGRDPQSTAALQRRHATFEHELVALCYQVQQVQEEAAQLIVAYSGEKARDIQQHEMDVVNAWRNLQLKADLRKSALGDSNDLYRFFGMARDLTNWMNDMMRQAQSQDKPRDVSGVELLMSNHQSLKAEIDARDENFAICVNLGKDLLARKHHRSPEVREKLLQLATQRGDMMDQWKDKWEYLQLILEVYQFARDATVADSWLAAHEPYVTSQEFGETLDAVEALLKKHESFEKAAATQEERFQALERLTMFEMREVQKRKRDEYMREHPDATLPPLPASFKEVYIREFLPPEEPSKPPTPEPVSPVKEPQSPVEVQQPEVPQAEAQKVVIEQVTHENLLSRKHLWENATKKATNRSWEKMFVALANKSLSFYKDQKHAKSDPKTYFHHELPLELEGSVASPATDYNKRPNVFNLKFTSGAEYLFQCRDEEEMNVWIEKINIASGAHSSSSHPSRSQTLPATSAADPKSSSAADEPKKRKMFTLSKKK
ncbi:hypothetical protein HELRODRAFT_101195 [Helobdella robusta]|uniref:Spectrin beta chain n=1 Tax=Helobdella robusta TaxID=6412 RepID=T1ED35_HELRO|nr:hypothetical protein HELRODRAFT_101195 [Helobdella robusta]ESN99908.1 hypothetical protein HELRODRAFT_101195 [Helobdella robusta]